MGSDSMVKMPSRVQFVALFLLENESKQQTMHSIKVGIHSETKNNHCCIEIEND